MRYLFVNQYYPPDTAATARILADLTEALDGEGHDVWVVAGKPSYRPDSPSSSSSVQVLRTHGTSFDRSNSVGRLLNYVTFLITATLRSFTVPKPAAVVTMTDPPIVGLVGLLAGWRFRVPFILICQDVHPDIGQAIGKMDSPILVIAVSVLNRLIRWRAAHIVAIGRDMKIKLESKGVPPQRITYLPGWSSANTTSDSGKQSIRREFGWQDRRIVMHAGNVGLAQDLETLVRAASLLKDDERWLFVIMGDGASRASLTRLAELLKLQNVQFIEHQTKERAEQIVACADVHIVSLAPGLYGCAAPSKVYGIMAAGRPFIAAVDQESEAHLIVQEFNCGRRVTPQDPEALAAAISSYTPEAVKACGTNARRAFEDYFERSVVLASFTKLLAEVPQANTTNHRPADRSH